MKKKAYVPPAVARVDLVTHEVALQVRKTGTNQVQPTGSGGKCTTPAVNPCRSVEFAS